jgi:wyosine [tRNA(Phe)-imidazoG37] synthetase (radical SAM superfamily)
MKYVFGPVPSRRLGQSLGIDTIPLKTCNWNCVYCQLGRTRPVTNRRKEYFPADEILMEVEESLRSHDSGQIDWVTFVGSGEPTLHTKIGWLIREVKKISDLPVAVITNGALLYLPEVRLDLIAADAVLPSLDAGTAELYRQINRPYPEITFERYLGGLVDFQSRYWGKLWIEVMLVQGLNDTEEALRGIAEALERIQPDEVHINFPTRPPVETWVQPPDEDGLMRASAILGEFSRVVHPAEGTFDLSGYENPLDAIVSIITRHPMRQDQIERSLNNWSRDEVERSLSDLIASGRAQVVDRYGVHFWSAKPSFYPIESKSQTTSPERFGVRRIEKSTRAGQ